MAEAPIRLTHRQFYDRMDTASGFCPSCQSWSDDGVGPDDEGVLCGHCGCWDVVGVRYGRAVGLIEIVGTSDNVLPMNDLQENRV